MCAVNVRQHVNTNTRTCKHTRTHKLHRNDNLLFVYQSNIFAIRRTVKLPVLILHAEIIGIGALAMKCTQLLNTNYMVMYAQNELWKAANSDGHSVVKINDQKCFEGFTFFKTFFYISESGCAFFV